MTDWEARLREVMGRGGLRASDLRLLLDVYPSRLHAWLHYGEVPRAGHQTEIFNKALAGIERAIRDGTLPLDASLNYQHMKASLHAIRQRYILKSAGVPGSGSSARGSARLIRKVADRAPRGVRTG